jgi:hypothetical protein
MDRSKVLQKRLGFGVGGAGIAHQGFSNCMIDR